MANVFYSNAMAKSLENNLLGKERLCRMVETNNPEEAFKILSEVNFGSGVELKDYSEYEKAISEEKSSLYLFVRQNCPSEIFKKFLLLKNDFHNAEVFIKCKHLKIDGEAMTTHTGLIDKELLRDKIMKDDYKYIYPSLKKALSSIDSDFVFKRATGKLVNLKIEKAYFDELYLIAKQDKYLLDIYSVKADSANLSLALRGKNFPFYKEFFALGGEISIEELKCLSLNNVESVKDKFVYSKRKDMVNFALSGVSENKPLSEFEKYSEEYALKSLLKYKYELTGILPFITYCYYKLAELRNVRIIMSGLIDGIDKEEIKNMMRISYAG